MNKKKILVEKNPDAFYKKIWFYLLLAGLLTVLASAIVYLYLTKFNLSVVYALLGVGVAFIFIGSIISLLSFKNIQPTLKTFKGDDLGVTEKELLHMDIPQLEETYSKITGVPVKTLRSL